MHRRFDPTNNANNVHNKTNQSQVVVRIPSSEVEALRSFLDYTGGEVLKETRIRKRKRADSCGEDQHGDTAELNTGNNT